MRTVKRLVPSPVKRALKGTARAARSRVELRALKRDYRTRYGPGLVYKVNGQDEMYRFIRDFWEWRHHVVRMRAPSDALYTYLTSGDLMTRDLEAALRDEGRELYRVASFLEFASGYGRFTRFLVTRVDPAKVTVSDINHSAVDFARKTFGVSGFYSTESASDLDPPPRQYEVIFVASLFSHLAYEHWTAWLQRLYEMLAPGGLLVFSTHGVYARDVIFGTQGRDRIESKVEGYSFFRSNETEGRLPVDYYGSAFVTEEFVQHQVATHGLGTIKQVYPTKLWGSQDLYVLEKPAAAREQPAPAG